MKNLLALTLIITALSLTSCQDCKDCQSTSTLNLRIEYFTLEDGTYNLSSTDSYSYSGTGSISPTSLPTDTSEISLTNSTSPILTQEFCGDQLKDYNNETLSFEQTIGDTLSGLFKYTWTENWDCQ